MKSELKTRYMVLEGGHDARPMSQAVYTLDEAIKLRNHNPYTRRIHWLPPTEESQ